MKKFFALCLSVILLLAIPVFGYAENEFLGESGKVFEAWEAWDEWELYMKVDGKKDRIYDAEDGPLILECNELLDGEDTGASAKVYIMSDWLLHVFIEVTDPELVTPTAEQQVEPAKGAEAFDCVTVILDPKNYLDPSDNGYEPEETGDEPVDKSDMSKRLRIYRMDHTGFGYVEHDIISDLYGKYFTNNDFYGWGEPLSTVLRGKGVLPEDNDDPSACVGFELTDKGYNIEFAAPLQAYAEGTEYGINIVLSDAYNGGESVSHYTIASSTNNKEPLNLANFDYFCLGSVIVDMPPEEDTSAETESETMQTPQTEKPSESTATTGGVTTDAADEPGGGNYMVYIIAGAAVILVVAGIVVFTVIRRKKKE